MAASTLMDRRKVTTARRHRPSSVDVRVLTADGDGALGPEIAPTPSEVHLEVTYNDGQVVTWFDDNWWLEILRRWKDRPLTIHFKPTPDALLHSFLIHELEMVRRLMVPWRLVGHCYLSDIGHPLLMSRVAVNPYDEIRIIDMERPSSDEFETKPSNVRFEDVISRVHEIQHRERIGRPIITRAPDPNGSVLASDSSTLA